MGESNTLVSTLDVPGHGAERTHSHFPLSTPYMQQHIAACSKEEAAVSGFLSGASFCSMTHFVFIFAMWYFFFFVWNKKTFSLGEHLLLLRDMCVKHKERWWGGMWTNLKGMLQWDGPVREIMNFFSSCPKSLKKLFIISQKGQTWRRGLVKIEVAFLLNWNFWWVEYNSIKMLSDGIFPIVITNVILQSLKVSS